MGSKGSYTREELGRTDIKALSKELRHADGGCLRCGHKSHWAKDCYANTDVCGNDISDDEYEEEEEEKDEGGAGGGAQAGRGAGARAGVRGGGDSCMGVRIFKT